MHRSFITKNNGFSVNYDSYKMIAPRLAEKCYFCLSPNIIQTLKYSVNKYRFSEPLLSSQWPIIIAICLCYTVKEA